MARALLANESTRSHQDNLAIFWSLKNLSNFRGRGGWILKLCFGHYGGKSRQATEFEAIGKGWRETRNPLTTTAHPNLENSDNSALGLREELGKQTSLSQSRAGVSFSLSISVFCLSALRLSLSALGIILNAAFSACRSKC